jgi:hypothetical protein
MLRRIVAIGSLLGLLALEPGALSLCAILTQSLGECAPPSTKTACDQMNTAQPDTQVSAQARKECCELSSAPIPEAQGKASAPAPELLKDDVVLLSVPAACGAPRESNSLAFDTSPPDLLPLLCTFLI